MNTAAAKQNAALQQVLELLKVQPNHGNALMLVYQACLATERSDGKKRIEKILRQQPDNVGLKRVAARLYLEWEEYDRQFELLDALYKEGVRSETFYDDYARSLKNTGQPETCLLISEEGLKQYPDSLALLKLRANAHYWLGHHKEALADGQKILAQSPDDHYVRTTIGSLKLMLSDFREGFEEYAAHQHYEIARLGFTVAPELPEWRGEPLKGKRLLLWVSQGIGDIVMFAGFIPWLIAQSAIITLGTMPKAVPFFARSFPDIEVIPFTPELLSKPVARFDFHAPLGQLMPLVMPYYTPADHPPYMKADRAMTQSLRQQYQQKAPGKKLVGISWHTINSDTFAQRNIPLECWQPLFALKHIRLVSLQYGDHSSEIKSVNRNHRGVVLMDDAVDAFGDTDALAAQIAAMDTVVSIQNSTVHVAGALGVPTTILLSAASEWRWGTTGSSNRWYGSVTVERQATLLEWQSVLERAANRL